MSTQLAAKLQPYFNYIVVGQLVLIAIVAAWAFLIIIKRVRSRSIPGDLMMDADMIAGEISQEISRLHNLRKRLSSKFHEQIGGDPGIQAAAHAGGPEVTSAMGDGTMMLSGDAKDLEQQIEARYLDTVTDLKNQIQKAEQEKAELVQKMEMLGGDARNDAPKIENDGALKDATESKAKLEAEKAEAKEKILHLERVISEYRLFEEDFALVKRYKVENERLKKQLTESHQVTEDDISKLFGAIETTDATPSVGTDPNVSPDNFFASEFSANASANPAAEETIAATEHPADVARAAAPAEIATAAESSEIEDELAKLLATGGSSAAETPAAAEPAVTIAAVVAEPAVTAPAPTPAAPAPVATKEFEVDRIKDEPTLNSSKVNPEEDLEAMAEAAGSDDKLLEEFQKILGEKS